MPIDITTKGARPGADNTGPIQAALDAAKAARTTAFVPAGVFPHSGVIRLDGVAISGVGDASVLQATNPQAGALMLSGDGAGVTKLRIIGAAGKRESAFECCGLAVLKAKNWIVDSVTLDHTSAAGMHISGSSNGKVTNNRLSYTGADSIHMSNYEGPNHDIEVAGNRIDHGGDDGIAVVSYKSGEPSYNIDVHDNAVTDQIWGRGYTVVGGHDVQIHDNYYNMNVGEFAGVYISAEAEWNTLPVDRVTVARNVICNAGGKHGSIQGYASSGTVTNVTYDANTIHASRNVNILLNGGGGQSGIVVTNNTGYGSQPLLNDSANARPQQSGNVVKQAIAVPTLEQWLASRGQQPATPTPPPAPPAPAKPPAPGDSSFGVTVPAQKATVGPAFKIIGTAASRWVNVAAYDITGKKLGSDAKPAGGAFTIDVPAGALAKGAQTIAVKAWDVPAGQAGGSSTEVKVDVTVSDAPAKRMAVVTKDGAQVVTFEAPVGSDVKVTYTS